VKTHSGGYCSLEWSSCDERRDLLYPLPRPIAFRIVLRTSFVLREWTFSRSDKVIVNDTGLQVNESQLLRAQPTKLEGRVSDIFFQPLQYGWHVQPLPSYRSNLRPSVVLSSIEGYRSARLDYVQDGRKEEGECAMLVNLAVVTRPELG
jgi:hypothetical protein